MSQKGTFGGLAQPEVPVQFLGRLPAVERPARDGVAHGRLGREFAAQASAAGDGHGFEKGPLELAPLLRAHLKHPAALLHRPADDLALLDRQRQRFFAIHVLAGLHCIDGDLDVPMVGRADGDGLHVPAVEHLAVILIDLALAAELLGEVVGVAQMHVGAGDHVTQPCGLAANIRAAPAHADGGHNEFIAVGYSGVGRGAAEEVWRRDARCRHAGAALQEVAACGSVVVHSCSRLIVGWGEDMVGENVVVQSALLWHGLPTGHPLLWRGLPTGHTVLWRGSRPATRWRPSVVGVARSGDRATTEAVMTAYSMPAALASVAHSTKPLPARDTA